jgi:hypothetical protein
MRDLSPLVSSTADEDNPKERVMQRRHIVAALLVASLLFIVASVAQATPTQVNVRIEGKSETLFEGPIWTEGHDVKASSDTQARSCNGTNNHQHATAGPTPTASAVDAMRIITETFDAQWYGSSFDDYFLTRFGPDEQGVTESAYWGILVNNVFANVGGCQYELGPDNEVLWAYDAFKERPFLALLPVAAGYTSGPRPLTAIAELGKPFSVEVINYADDREDNPPSTPERTGSTPEPGARVSPVHTASNGFEKIETESSPTVVTDAQGKASITFTTPGWHRIKATVVTPQGMEVAVRSNRLDVCVPAEGQSTCGEPPAEDQVRTPPPPEAEGIEETPPLPMEPIHITPMQSGGPIVSGGGGSGPPKTVPLTGTGSPTAGLANIQSPILDGRGAARGLVGVSWRILEPGVGLTSWTIASRTLGAGSAYVRRATGTTATSALLKLPAGAVYEIQITFTDVLGRTSTAQVGKVLVPSDDRWSGLHYRGHWQRKKQAAAWLDTVSGTGAGGQVSVRLRSGRPVFLLRGTATGAKVEVHAGSRREVFAIARGRGNSSRLILAAERSHAGTVSMCVLTGTVNLDGVAVEL